MGDGQGKSVHMLFISSVFHHLKPIVVPSDLPRIEKPLGKINPRNMRLSAWTLAILANPLGFVFDAGSDRLPVGRVKFMIHGHDGTSLRGKSH